MVHGSALYRSAVERYTSNGDPISDVRREVALAAEHRAGEQPGLDRDEVGVAKPFAVVENGNARQL
jgi:hypothetical protein